MAGASDNIPATDVATQVFEDFLEALTKQNLPSEVISGMRKTLLEEKQFTERALRLAIFPSDPTV